MIFAKRENPTMGMPTAPRRRWFQVSLSGMLVATFWSAAFCSGLVLFKRVGQHELVALENERAAYFVIALLLNVSPLAAIGGLFGRARWGAAIGIALTVLLALVGLYLRSVRGQ